jgi:hypothetical protein
MKRTNVFIITGFLFLFLSISGASFAQETKKEQAAKMLTDTMKTQLSLNDDQYKQVYDINLDFISKLGAAKQDAGGKMAKFKKMKEVDQDRDAAMKKILTEDQFKSFQEHKKENRKELKDRYRNKQ